MDPVKVWCVGCAAALLALLAVAVTAAAASASATNYRGWIRGLREVQTLGKSYMIRVKVQNRSENAMRLCFDFGDGDNAWEVRGLAMRAFGGDAFCVPRRQAARSTAIYRFRLIPLKPGRHTLSLRFGPGEAPPGRHRIRLDEAPGIFWEGQFTVA